MDYVYWRLTRGFISTNYSLIIKINNLLSSYRIITKCDVICNIIVAGKENRYVIKCVTFYYSNDLAKLKYLK